MGAVTKPNRHIFTIARCDSCHNASVWIPATFSHVGLALGSCQTCHNGFTATGKSSGHLPVTTSCDNCHRTTDWLQQVVFSHQGIVSGCSNCHGGQAFLGVKPLSKPSNHVDTQNQDCASCHPSTTSFQVATAASMPAGHVPTQMACQTCHSSFGPNSGVMNHAGIVNGCAQCHNGQRFAGVTPMSKPTTHLPTSTGCEACHSTSNFTAFSNATMSHAGIVNNCTNCHNGQTFAGVTPISKAAFPSHPPTAADCSTCHSSTVSFATNVSMTTLPANHLPTSSACSTCHNPAAFIPGVMSHTGIINNCTNCHNGQRFVGVTPMAKPTNHLPTNSGCETCHSSSNFIAFSGARMTHSGIVNGCAQCHNGQVFAGVTPLSKAAFPTHQVTSDDCSVCHSSTSSFASGVSTSTKPANHLPTSSACSTCHNAAAFVPGVMNHAGITNGCATCHNGQRFAGITPISKPSNHIPYEANLTGGASMGCEFCHSPSVFTRFTALTASTTLHNNTQGNGSGSCKACHLSGTNYLGGMRRNSLNHEGSGNDCSQSGCHTPLGRKGTAYINWD